MASSKAPHPRMQKFVSKKATLNADAVGWFKNSTRREAQGAHYRVMPLSWCTCSPNRAISVASQPLLFSSQSSVRKAQ